MRACAHASLPWTTPGPPGGTKPPWLARHGPPTAAVALALLLPCYLLRLCPRVLLLVFPLPSPPLPCPQADAPLFPSRDL